MKFYRKYKEEMKTAMEKRNICVTAAYDGSAFLGWQSNEKRDRIPVQDCLEQALSQVTEGPVELTGAGRTDRGVHARGQTANFYTCSLLEAEEIRLRTNRILPDAVRLTGAARMKPEFHSRYDALWKEYSYRIAFGEKPSVFRRNYVYHCPCAPDLSRMREGALLLEGTHDFRGFSSVKDPEKRTTRTLERILIEERPRDEMVITFRGDGFLYHMVRILSGTLLEIGRGRTEPGQIRSVLQSGCREQAGPTLPACGLTMERICYEGWDSLELSDALTEERGI